MAAPSLGTARPRRVLTDHIGGFVRGLVLALAAVLAATLLGPAQTTSASAGSTDRPDPGFGVASTDRAGEPTLDPRLDAVPRMNATSARSNEGRDVPVLPSKCFGPGRMRIEPFPCPLNRQRKGQPTIILWGDSHAYEWIPAMVEAVKGQPVNLVSMVAGSCPPVLVTSDPGAYQCKRSNWIAYKYVRQLMRDKVRFKVVLGSNWSGFRRGYRAMFLEEVGGPATGYVPYTRSMISMAHEGTPALFTKLGSLGVDVDIIGQAATVPARRPACEAGDDPYNCDILRWRAIPEEYATRVYLQRLQAKITRRGESRIIDPLPGYCDALVCHGKVGDIETFFDDLHVSATRSRRLASYFVPAVKAVRR